MEIRRYVLMAALAVVAYFMFLSWQNDFSAKPQTQQQIVSQQQQNAGQINVPDASQLVAEKTATDSATTKSATTDSATTTVVADTTTPSVANKSNLIHVTTDVYQLAIDPRGGDIISLYLLDYPIQQSTPNQPFPLLAHSASLIFEAQSGLIGPDGTDTGKSRPLYQAKKSHYTLQKGQDKLVVNLTLPQHDGVTITKQYVFHRGSYQIKVANKIQNQSGSPWKGAFYGQLKRDGSDDPSSGSGFAVRSYLGGAYYSKDNEYEKLDFDDIRDESSKFHLQRQGGWFGLSQHYFLTSWIGDADKTNTYSSSYTKTGPETGFYYLRYISPVKTIAPGETATFDTRLYAGPKLQDRLADIAPGLGLTIGYGWSWFIAKPIFAVLVFLESGQFNLFGQHFDLGFGVGNWGVAIILLTIIIKLLFFRLSATAYRSMAKMRKVAPEMKRIKEKHKDDRQKQSQAMMKLYQKEKINPIGGCLPMVIQAPVFIALYYVLLYSVELRQAPFIFWIHDLSMKDPYFILPILMGAAMFFQMRLNPTPADNTQAMVMKWMPVGFTVFFMWFPSGLVLYYLTNNLLSIAQQYWITKKIENEG